MIPQRILMTTDTVGGVWTYALALARALGPCGVEVVLAAMGGPVSADQRAAVEQTANVRLFERCYKLEWMDNPWRDVDAAGRWLLELEAQFRPEIIHLNGYAHGALTWSAPVLVVGHSCVLSWWMAVHRTAAPARYGEYRRRVAEGLQRAHCIAAPTAAMLAALQAHYGTVRNGMVIPNGCDAREFRTGQKQPIVLAAGRLWDEAKNFAALDNIAPHLEWPVFAAGDPAPPGKSAITFRHLQMLGRLPAPELAQQFARAAIFASPAYYEPFGLSILEAALSGCALVLGDIPSLREIWSGAARFVPPGDAEALRSALGGLIRNTASRAEMGRRARIRAEIYSMRAMREGYLAAYGKLLEERRQAEGRE